MKEKEINKSYSTIQPNSFSFAKSRDLKHIKVSEMKFVKGKFVKETACGRNLVEPVDFPNQIKETNRYILVVRCPTMGHHSTAIMQFNRERKHYEPRSYNRDSLLCDMRHSLHIANQRYYWIITCASLAYDVQSRHHFNQT